MSKFIKRLTKNNINISDNALIVGERFGHLEDLVKIYETVFIVSKNPIIFKSKNLIYRHDFQDISVLPTITSVFTDPLNFEKLTHALPIITKYRPNIIVNSSTIIEKIYCKGVYQIGYRPVEIFNDYQLWKKIK